MTPSFALQTEHNGAYYLPTERRAAFQSLVQAAQQDIQSIDLSRCTTISGALKKVGKTLRFPTWYGANLDALFDCLTDPDWLAGSARIISLSGTQKLAASEPEAFSGLLDVLQSVAETLRDDGILFWALLDTDHPALKHLPEA